MNRRIPIALVVACLISGACTYLLEKKLKFLTASQQQQMLKYVTPVRPLAAGEVLKPADLAWTTWPVSAALPGAIAKTEVAVGRVVLYPVEKGQPLLERDLAAPGIGAGLGSKIPEGMRALALRSDEVVGVAGFLTPGSRLDVLVTYHTESSPEAVTATVLQNAAVLAAGQQADPDPSGKPTIATVVTLLVTPLEAERAVAASTQGVIHFVLRNVLDTRQVESAPVSLSSLAGGRAPVLTAAPAAAVPVAPVRPVPSLYRQQMVGSGVQTIFGDNGGDNSGDNGGDKGTGSAGANNGSGTGGGSALLPPFRFDHPSTDSTLVARSET